MDPDTDRRARPWRDAGVEDGAAGHRAGRPAGPVPTHVVPADPDATPPAEGPPPPLVAPGAPGAGTDGPTVTPAQLPVWLRPGDDPVPRHAGSPPPADGHAREGDPPAVAGAGRGGWAVARADAAGPGRPETRGSSGWLRSWLVGLVAGVVGAVLGTTATLTVADRGAVPDEVASDEVAPTVEVADEPSPSSSPPPAADVTTIVSDVAAAVLPSVVRIDTFVTESDPDLGDVDVPAGVGSGVAWTADGIVLTNNHVVAGADTVRVTLGDGTEHDARVVGTDRLTDLAVLDVGDVELVPVTLRLDEPLRVGETAVAIGSPFGLDASVTAGVVSAVNRDLEVPADGDEASFVIPATIQTDAAINPGNSGGALVDAGGRLIGINTAILTTAGGSQGVGFAIPTSSVVAAAEQLIERGAVSHPFLGIQGLDVTNALAARYAEEHGVELDGGAVVESVIAGSGAAAAGLRPDDIIVRFGDERISAMTEIIAAVLRYDVGDVVPVVVLRDGEALNLRVTLGERPSEEE